jgi:hypothetical protein
MGEKMSPPESNQPGKLPRTHTRVDIQVPEELRAQARADQQEAFERAPTQVDTEVPAGMRQEKPERRGVGAYLIERDVDGNIRSVTDKLAQTRAQIASMPENSSSESQPIKREGVRLDIKRPSKVRILLNKYLD